MLRLRVKMLRAKSNIMLRALHFSSRNKQVKEVSKITLLVNKQFKQGKLKEEEVEEWFELVADSCTKQDLLFSVENCYSEIVEFYSRLNK